jgi:UDP-glucose-4-epimerase GalE
MTILVTGGAGYIGSHAVRLLRERGRDVVVLDSMEFGNRAAIGNTPLVEADIADGEVVATVISQYHVDAVMHFAGYKAAGESMENPGRYFANNVSKSAALMESLSSAGIKRVVFSSSSAIYGTPERVPVDESAPVCPESPYGESKAIVERMLSWYDRCHGLRSVSLRYFNAAGAWPDGSIGEDWGSALNLVPLVMKAAAGRRDAVRVFGTDYPTSDGTAIRDYVHVVDLADAHIKALEYLDAGGATAAFNLGTGVGSSVFEVLTAAEKVTGTPIPYELAGRRSGDPVALFSDTRLANEILGWRARSGLDNIVASAWAWHASHLDGYVANSAW